MNFMWFIMNSIKIILLAVTLVAVIFGLSIAYVSVEEEEMAQEERRLNGT